MLRLLLIEDDPDRIARFSAWCPTDVRLVVTCGGGRAHFSEHGISGFLR